MGQNKSTSNFKRALFAFTIVLVFNNSLSAQVYPASDPTNTGGWVLNTTISDEFEDSAINESKWLIQGRNGVYQSNFIGRSPSQFSMDNAILESGKLKILTKWDPDYPFTQDSNGNMLGYYNGEVLNDSGNRVNIDEAKPITTAAVISKQQFQYGYMEIKSKAANAEITSSFWTTGFQSELDMFEMFGGHKSNTLWRKRLKFNMISWDPNNYYYLPDGNGPAYTENIQADNNTADAFHTYGFHWTADFVKVYIDGVLKSEIFKTDVTNNGSDPEAWVTDVPYWVWVDSETFPWLGLPDESDLTVPAEYQIEYIRVWQTNDISIAGTQDGSEPNNNGEFKVSLPNGTVADQNITVNYSVGGTATEGTDYTALSGTVTILNGNNSAVIPINVLDDNDTEGTETVEITLTSASVGTVNTTPAEIIIADTGTVLTAGDIAIVGWKAEGNGNGAVAFMLLKDIVAGTKISFSNRSWKGSQDGWTGDFGVDDVWTWTADANYSIGAIFKLDSDGLVKRVTGDSEITVGTTVHNVAGKTDPSDDDTDFDLQRDGDSVLVYQVYGMFSELADPNSPSWITGINTNGGWGTGGGNAFCALPTALTNGVNANAVGTDQDNGVYKEKLEGGTSILRSTINNDANWISDEDTAFNLWSYAETVGGISGDIGIVGSLSTQDIQSEFTATVYPNPLNKNISREIHISSPETLRISMYNVSGIKIIEKDKLNEPETITLPKLRSGLYFIYLTSSKGVTTKKIIIE